MGALMDDPYASDRLFKEQTFDRFVALEGKTFETVVTSSDPRPNVTISVDAMETIADIARAWFGTRAMQRLDAKLPAKRVRVSITVDFDDVAVTDVGASMTVIDGERRTR